MSWSPLEEQMDADGQLAASRNSLFQASGFEIRIDYKIYLKYVLSHTHMPASGLAPEFGPVYRVLLRCFALKKKNSFQSFDTDLGIHSQLVCLFLISYKTIQFVLL